MSDKVKPWHSRKPKQHDKNRRPNHKKKDEPCPLFDGEDLDKDGSMLSVDPSDYSERWES